MDVGAELARNPFVAAPLDGYSDKPWRAICRRHGAGLCFTEMVPAIALGYYGRDAMRRIGIGEGDWPTAVQIEGADPSVMARAAVICQENGARMIDINAGCPSRRITNGGAGSALLSDLFLLERILLAVKAAVTIPVTLKVRSGPTASRLVLEDIARMAADTGMAAVTLHPRTRSQAFKGSADWNLITRMKPLLQVPLIGNGDVLTGDDGVRMLRETGCDGVMVGRGAVGNPWIFRDLHARWRGEPTPPRPTLAEWREVVVAHFHGMVEEYGDEGIAARLFRKHLAKYARGMAGAVNLRRSLPGIESRPTLLAALDAVLRAETSGTVAAPHQGPAVPGEELGEPD